MKLKKRKLPRRMNLPKKVVVYLMAVADFIEANYKTFDMSVWAVGPMQDAIEEGDYNSHKYVSDKAVGITDFDQSMAAIKDHMRKKHKPFSCGTSACLAGHIVIGKGIPELEQIPNTFLPPSLRTHPDRKATSFIADVAARIALGVRNVGGDDLFFLFHAGNWPEPYKSMYSNGFDSEGSRFDEETNRRLKAHVAADRLRYFARTGL